MNISRISVKKWTWLSVWLLLLYINGCMPQAMVSNKPVAADERSAVDYYLWASDSPAVVIDREIKYLEKRPETLDPVVSKTRLAMVMTLSAETTSKDEKIALELLDQVIEETNATNESAHIDYRQFSRLWREIILQRQKLKQSERKVNQQIEKVNKKLRALQEENEELNKQIEALKSIEQQINKREQKRENKQ